MEEYGCVGLLLVSVGGWIGVRVEVGAGKGLCNTERKSLASAIILQALKQFGRILLDLYSTRLALHMTFSKL